MDDDKLIVTSEQVYQSGPPAKLQNSGDGDVVTTTRQEEWVTSKKRQTTTTREIETHIKRNVVVEDGQLVEDSGPTVSQNTRRTPSPTSRRGHSTGSQETTHQQERAGWQSKALEEMLW